MVAYAHENEQKRRRLSRRRPRGAGSGRRAAGVPRGRRVHPVAIAGSRPRQPWHGKIGDLTPVEVPADAEAIYEATCFAADGNALEVRELLRSGPTRIPEVQAARDAFFGQPLFRGRHLWDRNLFDGDSETGLGVCRRWPRDPRVRNGSFRLDLGAPTALDTLRLEVGGDYFLQPLKSGEAVAGSVSADLSAWERVHFYAERDLELRFPAPKTIRYARLDACPDLIREVTGTCAGRALDRSGWRASNLLATYASAPATHAWSLSFRLDEAAAGMYLAIAIHGQHGRELAYAGLRAPGGWTGAPRRSPSFPSNSWEVPVRFADGNYTYYVPVTPAMAGQPLEAVVLLLRGGKPDIRCEAWRTAYPPPLAAQEVEASGSRGQP